MKNIDKIKLLISNVINEYKKSPLNTDHLIVEICMTIDSMDINQDDVDELFDNLSDVELNEDLYIAFLSYTIGSKSIKRKQYIDFVTFELNKKYTKTEISQILIGL